MTLGHHTKNEVKYYKKTKTEVRGDENYWLPHPHYLCPCQIVGWRVTKVQHQLPHQCYQGPIDLGVPGVQTMANDATGSLEAI